MPLLTCAGEAVVGAAVTERLAERVTETPPVTAGVLTGAAQHRRPGTAWSPQSSMSQDYYDGTTKRKDPPSFATIFIFCLAPRVENVRSGITAENISTFLQRS